MEALQSKDPVCPVCESGDTGVRQPDLVDYEYGVVPKRAFHYRLCRSCRSEFLLPMLHCVTQGKQAIATSYFTSLPPKATRPTASASYLI